MGVDHIPLAYCRRKRLKTTCWSFLLSPFPHSTPLISIQVTHLTLPWRTSLSKWNTPFRDFWIWQGLSVPILPSSFSMSGERIDQTSHLLPQNIYYMPYAKCFTCLFHLTLQQHYIYIRCYYYHPCFPVSNSWSNLPKEPGFKCKSICAHSKLILLCS